MATVYLARDTELRREVAIKVLFPHLSKRRDVVARFQREARAAAGLDHPHILRVLDIGGGDPSEQDDGKADPPYIVLELVRGPSLKDWIDRRGAPMAEIVACLGVAVARALGEAHAAGIIHRDVKPANIMVAEGGRVVLTDFGVARVTDEDSVVTKTGALLGTPSYMSPEQATAGELDARSDLYSLGATLYQLATGSLPFSGPTARVVGQIMAGDFVPPIRRTPMIGPDLSAAIMRMMSLEPRDRFESAAEVEARLEEIAEAGGIDDIEDALSEYFDNPSETSKSLRNMVIASTLSAAHTAGDDGNMARAIALADRVLALDDGNQRALDLVNALGRRGRLRTFAIAGAAIAALAAGAIAAVAWWPADSANRTAASSVADADLAAADIDGAVAETADATPMIAADASVELAVADAMPDARPSKPTRIVHSRPPDAAPIARVESIDAGVRVAARPDAAPKPANKASFSLTADAWCNLFVDGGNRGRLSASDNYEVEPGKRTIRCEQTGLGRAWSRTITFSPGQHKNLSATLLEDVAVKVAVKNGDSVRIGGRTYKNGASLTVKRGSKSVQVLSGGRVIATKHVKFVTSCTLRDSPRVSCAP